MADRGASVRIGRETYEDGKGYLEDRRPSSNMDPYIVTSLLLRTCCSEEYDISSEEGIEEGT